MSYLRVVLSQVESFTKYVSSIIIQTSGMFFKNFGIVLHFEAITFHLTFSIYSTSIFVLFDNTPSKKIVRTFAFLMMVHVSMSLLLKQVSTCCVCLIGSEKRAFHISPLPHDRDHRSTANRLVTKFQTYFQK